MEDYEIRNQRIEEQLKATGRVIQNQLPEGWGFAVFMFEYGKGGSMFYISSGDREGVKKSLQEFLIKQNTRGKHQPGHKKGA